MIRKIAIVANLIAAAFCTLSAISCFALGWATGGLNGLGLAALNVGFAIWNGMSVGHHSQRSNP